MPLPVRKTDSKHQTMDLDDSSDPPHLRACFMVETNSSRTTDIDGDELDTHTVSTVSGEVITRYSTRRGESWSPPTTPHILLDGNVVISATAIHALIDEIEYLHEEIQNLYSRLPS